MIRPLIFNTENTETRAFVLFPCGIVGNRSGDGFRVEIYGLDGVIDGKYGEFFFTAESAEPGFARRRNDYEKRPSGKSIISPSLPKRS